MNQAHALHTTEAVIGVLILKKIQIILASKHHFDSDIKAEKLDYDGYVNPDVEI